MSWSGDGSAPRRNC